MRKTVTIDITECDICRAAIKEDGEVVDARISACGATFIAEACLSCVDRIRDTLSRVPDKRGLPRVPKTSIQAKDRFDGARFAEIRFAKDGQDPSTSGVAVLIPVGGFVVLSSLKARPEDVRIFTVSGKVEVDRVGSRDRYVMVTALSEE